jgi:hypothetical protein
MSCREEEHAVRSRGSGTFPEEWGFAPGSTYSEERAAWVRGKVAQFGAAASGPRPKRPRPRTPRQIVLDAKKDAP